MGDRAAAQQHGQVCSPGRQGGPATGGRCPKACLEEAGMSVTYDRRGCQTQSHFPAFYRVAAESEHVA